MSKMLSVVRQPKFFVPAVIALLAVIGYLSLPKTNIADIGTAQNQQISTQKAKELDKKKIDGMYDMINVITAGYAKQHQKLPIGSRDGWAGILANVPTSESFSDPYTKTIYTYVDAGTNPDFGQIQYRPGSACDTKKNMFIEGTPQTIALRARLYNTYHCVSSIEAQAKQSQ
ncbi:MAG TPA: hypothetical protein VFT16_02550 [Candidatus Saccharimonadales bacterium]|nr:hypothetical protein [Candidatus Saccharimonadales bacterium]